MKVIISMVILLLSLDNSVSEPSCDGNYITQNENECKTLNPAFRKEYCCEEKYTGGNGGTRYLCIPLDEEEYQGLDLGDYEGILDKSSDPETTFVRLQCDFSMPKKNQNKEEESKSNTSNSKYLLNNIFILLLLIIINY